MTNLVARTQPDLACTSLFVNGRVPGERRRSGSEALVAGREAVEQVAARIPPVGSVRIRAYDESGVVVKPLVLQCREMNPDPNVLHAGSDSGARCSVFTWRIAGCAGRDRWRPCSWWSVRFDGSMYVPPPESSRSVGMTLGWRCWVFKTWLERTALDLEDPSRTGSPVPLSRWSGTSTMPTRR